MPDDRSSQSQSQTQRQTVEINVQSSGDPEFERHVFDRVHSVGRQLGRIAAVVEALLDAQAGAPNFAQTPQARAAVEAFRLMRADIAQARRLRDPDRLVAELENLRDEDPAAFSALRERLRIWLDED